LQTTAILFITVEEVPSPIFLGKFRW
jgi:hypothetical protein